jgi:hypothetical protein
MTRSTTLRLVTEEPVPAWFPRLRRQDAARRHRRHISFEDVQVRVADRSIHFDNHVAGGPGLAGPDVSPGLFSGSAIDEGLHESSLDSWWRDPRLGNGQATGLSGAAAESAPVTDAMTEGASPQG